MTINTQLELGISATPCRHRHHRQAARVNRARWWFGQMREAVANAVDCRKAPARQPEQIWLAVPRRTIRL